MSGINNNNNNNKNPKNRDDNTGVLRSAKREKERSVAVFNKNNSMSSINNNENNNKNSKNHDDNTGVLRSAEREKERSVIVYNNNNNRSGINNNDSNNENSRNSRLESGNTNDVTQYTSEVKPTVSFQEPLESTNSPTSNHSVVTIAHSLATTTTDASTARSTATLILGMSKPVFIGIAGLFFLSTCWAGFSFLDGFFKAPGLKQQVDVLKSQVSRLEVEVSDLDGLVIEFKMEVSRLNTTVAELSSEVDRLEDINIQLNGTTFELQTLIISDLTSLNTELEDRVEDFGREITSLNQSILEVTSEKDKLNGIVMTLKEETTTLNQTVLGLEIIERNLVETRNRLQKEVSNLTTTVSNLEDTNIQFQQSNRELTTQNSVLNDQNRKLETSIDMLEKILMDWYNNTASSPDDESFEEVLAQLNGIIDTNRALVLKNLELEYDQTIDAWLCSYRSTFAGEDFLDVTPNTPIGDGETYNRIQTHIQTEVLQPLCLTNSTNYNDFIQTEIMTSNTNKNADEELYYTILTSNTIRQIVARYTSEAMEYYFSLSSDDWAEAQYECNNLPSNLTFVWTSKKEE